MFIDIEALVTRGFIILKGGFPPSSSRPWPEDLAADTAKLEFLSAAAPKLPPSIQQGFLNARIPAWARGPRPGGVGGRVRAAPPKGPNLKSESLLPESGKSG